MPVSFFHKRFKDTQMASLATTTLLSRDSGYIACHFPLVIEGANVRRLPLSFASTTKCLVRTIISVSNGNKLVHSTDHYHLFKNMVLSDLGVVYLLHGRFPPIGFYRRVYSLCVFGP